MADQDFDSVKAAEELQAEIDKIDFDGGMTPGAEPPAPTPEPDVTDPEDDGEPTPEPDDGQQDAEPDVEPGEGNEPDSTQDDNADGEDDKPALPDSHYRSMLRMGWTAEDIGELYDQSPEAALRMAKKCYDSVNSMSKQLGQLGIAAQKAKETPVVQPTSQPSGRLDKLIEKVKDHYGDDDPMAEVLMEVLKERRQPEPAPAAAQEPAIPQRTVDEEIAARQQIQTFFGSDDMTAYADLYGEDNSLVGDWSKLTPGQRANRIEVCNRAQVLLYGAAAAGMEMGTAEALERAHLEVSAPMAEEIVRSRIAKSAKKRERSVTLKPSGGTPNPQSGGAFDHKQAVAEMKAELDAVFKTG